MKKTKMLASTAIFTAMYFILSALLKIPVAGHITLDLGYIAMTVSAIYLGPICTMFVGGVGAFLESALMAQRGMSLGWIAMNVIVGYICGLTLHKVADDGRKKIVTTALLAVPTSMLLGVAVKTLIDCLLYSLPLAAKIPTAIAAWILDSIVMLVIGLPLSLTLKKYGLKL